MEHLLSKMSPICHLATPPATNQIAVCVCVCEQVERDTAASMSCLVELDEVKTRMESSLQALQEADNWTSLAADVDIVFQSQDINLVRGGVGFGKGLTW